MRCLARAASLALVSCGLVHAPLSAEETTRWRSEDFSELVRGLASEDYSVREGATAELLEAGIAAAPACFAARLSTDPEVRSRADLLLAEIFAACIVRPDWAAPIVRGALDRLTSKSSFGTGDPEYREIVNLGQASIPPLLVILGENEPQDVKRIYAGAALAEVAQAEDMPSLVSLLADANVHVRIHVGSRCERIADAAFGYDANAGVENWGAARTRYETWWSENQERILAEARAGGRQVQSRSSGPSTRSGG